MAATLYKRVVTEETAEYMLGEHYSDFLEWVCGQKRPRNGYYRSDIDSFLSGKKPPLVSSFYAPHKSVSRQKIQA